MRPKHTALRARLEENCHRSTNRQGQKAHLLGDGSEQRSAQDHRNKNKKLPHARAPVSSSRTNSKLRSAGPAKAGLQQAQWSPEVAGSPTPAKRFSVLPDEKQDNLLLLWRSARRPLTDPRIWNQEPRLPDALAGRTTWSEHFRWTRALPAAWDQ